MLCVLTYFNILILVKLDNLTNQIYEYHLHIKTYSSLKYLSNIIIFLISCELPTTWVKIRLNLLNAKASVFFSNIGLVPFFFSFHRCAI